MVTPIQGSASSPASGGTVPSGAGALAERILADNRRGAGFDLATVRREIDSLSQRDPTLGRSVAEAVEQRLSPVERGELARVGYTAPAADGGRVAFAPDAPRVADYRAMTPGSEGRALYDRLDRAYGDGNPRTDDTAAIERGLRTAVAQAGTTPLTPTAAPAAGTDPVRLGLDLTQMTLDLTGIVDPTPVSDGGNALISVGRSIGSAVSGEWSEAGGHLANGGLSAVGIIPVLGDLAKAGKIGKWAQTIADATGAIARNPALRGTLEPALRQVRDLVNRIPQGMLDKLPAGARESLGRMKTQLDEFFGAATATFTRQITDTAQRLGIPPAKVDEIVAAGRGNRPEPTDYVPAARMEEHARAFEGGASRFTLQGNLDKYGLGQRDGTTFVMTRGEADRILRETGGDPRKLEEALGLPAGQLDGSALVRVDFPPEAMNDLNMRMPSGNEAGANDQWLPGGYLPNGTREAVIDGAQATPDQYRATPVVAR